MEKGVFPLYDVVETEEVEKPKRHYVPRSLRDVWAQNTPKLWVYELSIGIDALELVKKKNMSWKEALGVVSESEEGQKRLKRIREWEENNDVKFSDFSTKYVDGKLSLTKKAKEEVLNYFFPPKRETE